MGCRRIWQDQAEHGRDGTCRNKSSFFVENLPRATCPAERRKPAEASTRQHEISMTATCDPRAGTHSDDITTSKVVSALVVMHARVGYVSGEKCHRMVRPGNEE